MTNMNSHQKGFVWRTVKNGMVKVYGNYYVPRDNTPPIKEGERLLMYKYAFEDRFVGEHDPPIVDGKIIRMAWNKVESAV